MKRILILIFIGVLAFAIAGCGANGKPSSNNPVTLTVWHTYVEGMQDNFNKMVDEFNSTVGAENGVTIEVTAVANATVINENLMAAADKDPGAPKLPDMAVIYPNVAITLADKGVLADLGAQFTPGELAAYVPQFVQEGYLGGDTLYLMPIAKSTEVLYVNRTLFDRFSAETGVGIGQLSTFEGILDAADRYNKWTDAKTPDTPNDGKTFYYPDNLFNYSMIGMQQLGGDIMNGQKLNLGDPLFGRVFSSYFDPAVKGDVAIFSDYGNYLAKTGDVVCYTSTSAGATFCPASVTYADNTKEDVSFDVLPYPSFSGGEKVAVQRGGGMCVIKSDPVREYAAGVFLKWFTAPEQNLRFTGATGYMPVSDNAFNDVMADKTPPIDSAMVSKSLKTAAAMHSDYRFYFPPVFDGFEQLQSDYADSLRKTAQDAKDTYDRLLAEQDPDAAFRTAGRDALQNFVGALRQ